MAAAPASCGPPGRFARWPSPANVRDRAQAYVAALPADVTFSHITAAQLWDLPLPLPLEEQVALDVMRETTRGRIERHGCISHRGGERRSSATVHGLPVTSLLDTWVDLGEVVPRGLGRDDLVVAGDVVATRTSRVPPGSAITDAVQPLADALAARVRPRNKALLTASLKLVRPGVRSPMESRSRLVFVDAGFPEPEVNGHVHAADGGWLAECDLLWRAQRVDRGVPRVRALRDQGSQPRLPPQRASHGRGLARARDLRRGPHRPSAARHSCSTGSREPSTSTRPPSASPADQPRRPTLPDVERRQHAGGERPASACCLFSTRVNQLWDGSPAGSNPTRARGPAGCRVRRTCGTRGPLLRPR